MTDAASETRKDQFALLKDAFSFEKCVLVAQFSMGSKNHVQRLSTLSFIKSALNTRLGQNSFGFSWSQGTLGSMLHAHCSNVASAMKLGLAIGRMCRTIVEKHSNVEVTVKTAIEQGEAIASLGGVYGR